MKRSLQFILFVFAVSWTITGIAILLGLRTVQDPNYTIFAMGYMLLPAICAIILQLIHKEKPLRNLNISFKVNRWFLIAGIVPLIYTFLN